ncbi:MAG: sporulation protein YtfJ [Clostridia bacterium]|nr:sporulation protein YtfJ [Clostridia bacterium]
MNEHPIENLMITAMNSIQGMVDVNTIVGEPIETANGITIIPISKVGFGFAAGGSEFNSETIKEYNRKDKDEEIAYKLPFGGGAGAGVSINPVAFLVVQDKSVKLMPVEHESCLDRLFDYVPDLMQKVSEMFSKSIQQHEGKIQNIVTEMKDKCSSTNKPKSKEVEGQEQKVSENEKRAGYQEVSDCLEADGEIFD